MLQNEKVIIVGRKTVFVPYCAHHVEKYHQWMQSDELLELTASEPLSLEEEIEMQKSWQRDDDKCTFIVLQYCEEDSDMWMGPQTAEPNRSDVEVERMVGDVNLFLNDPDDKHVAEIDVMIAETSVRGKGYGSEVVRMMMHWGYTKLGIKKFVAKIGFANKASAALFMRLNYEKISECETFEETTFELGIDSDKKMEEILNGLAPSYRDYIDTANLELLVCS